ncbi:MAG: hypothetical protein ACE5FF_05405 [Saprospiraceae bacterium]
MRKIILTLTLSFIGLLASGQSTPDTVSPQSQLKIYEDTLGLMSFLVVNDSLPENRFAACKKLITTLVQALKIEDSFHYPFSRLHSVSILYPPDSTFRVFTWQLYVDKENYRYFGAIQMNSPELKLFPLIDRSFEVNDVEHEILTPEKWYGALYYNIRQFDTAEGRKYLLFGFDGFSFFNKRKLVDVLTIGDDYATFGAPVFVKQDSTMEQPIVSNRLLMEYSAEASCRMNFDETYDLILFEHLIPMAGNYGQGMTMVPDGSYEGYRLENGRWHWVEKVFHQTQEEAPRPEPVLDERGKDIFGKTKKKGN